MTFSILTLGGWLMVLRWIHFIAGVVWIGLLYYFNFVQAPFMAEADAAAKSQVTIKLLPRALWWFRWGAMFTWVSGVLILAAVGHTGGLALLRSSWWVIIATGAALATLMFLNVWLVIWPNQKVVIKNAEEIAKGAPANPKAADCALRASMASKTNTLFSIPMLFFMGAASHLGINVSPTANLYLTTGVVGIILAALEFNALKGKKPGPLAKPVGIIHSGLGLAVILYLVLELTTK